MPAAAARGSRSSAGSKKSSSSGPKWTTTAAYASPGKKTSVKVKKESKMSFADFQAKKASAALLEDGGESSTVARKASGGGANVSLQNMMAMLLPGRSGDDESGRNGSSGTARIRTISDSALAPSFPEAATGSIPGRTSPDPFADGELDKVHRVNQNNFGKKGLGSSER